ncbi:MAG: hypothetical protein CTY12_06900 [Methylotenera sp.]|nr:MAG: hypothetical protein CTY14_06880 [Methylotenera sp.]PPD52215.1 MAG: hypothetical protein CTY12_06900 [Methylotenera sp.]
MKITLNLQGNTLEYENDAVLDITEMGHAFGDGEDGNEFCYARTWQDFIGRAFHFIQQTGGVLKLNGQQIGAYSFESTNGNAVKRDTEVNLANGGTVVLSQLLR